jgi:multiple sugar transport system substrate-binding protein
LVWEYDEGGYQSDRFMELHPEVKIELVMTAGEEAKLDSMIAAGTPPDLFALSEVNFIRYYLDGVVLNLQPFIDVDPDFNLDDFFPDLLATSTGPDGNLYGLGGDFGAQLLWYNKTLLDKGGLSHPNPNWRWDDHRAAAAALTTGEGVEKVYGTLPFDWFCPQFSVIWQNEGRVFSDDATTCLMDSDEAIGALEYIMSYVEDGTAATPVHIAAMGLSTGGLFAGGRAALFPGGHWVKWEFADTEDFEWDVTALPQQKRAATFLHQAFWSASVATKHPQTAWDWIKWTTNREMSIYQCTYFGGQSTRKAVAEELATNPPEEAGPHIPKVWKALYDVALLGGKNYSNVVPFSEIIDSVWNPALARMWNKEATPRQIGQEIKTGADAILARS